MTHIERQAELSKYFYKPAPFWDSLPAPAWEEMKGFLITQKFPKKTLIYSEKSYPRSLYIIRKGLVKVYVMNNEGEQQVIYFLGKNEVFGHRSIVCDEPSPVFVETMEECEIDCIPRHHFERFLKESLELNAVFLNYLGNEFRVFVNKISVFAQKPVPERVALALLVLNAKFNDHPEYLMVLNFTREELASYVGTATENLIRQLKVLKEARIITVKGRKIILEETDQLWERARILLC